MSSGNVQTTIAILKSSNYQRYIQFIINSFVFYYRLKNLFLMMTRRMSHEYNKKEKAQNNKQTNPFSVINGQT